MDTFYSVHLVLVPQVSTVNSFYCSCTLIVQFQPSNNCSKSTVNTRKRCEKCSKSAINTQNEVIDNVLVSLSLTLNIFYNFFLLFLMLTLSRSPLARMTVQIVIWHNMAITHIVRWKKIKKPFGKCFQKLIIWNKILQKIV